MFAEEKSPYFINYEYKRNTWNSKVSKVDNSWYRSLVWFIKKKKNKNNSNSNNYNNSKLRLQCTAKLNPQHITALKNVIIILISLLKTQIARVSSLRKRRHLATLALVSEKRARPKNERRNPILMTRHYSDLDRAAEWSCRVGNLIQPIRSTIQIWVAGDESSVLNFCARFSDVIWRRNQW